MLLSLFGSALALATFLESRELAQAWFSVPLWEQVIHSLGGEVSLHGFDLVARVPLMSLLGVLTIPFFVIPLVITWRCRDTATSWEQSLHGALWNASIWGLVPSVWWLIWMVATVQGATGTVGLCGLIAPLVFPLFLAGITAPLLAGRSIFQADQPMPQRLGWHVPTALMSAYVIVFVLLNWGLWWNLQIPHGDSAMYEEHLWNFEHGKGFRSYLDQGLFLGEHIQVIHLGLIPLHLLWPSQLMMELCESVALALGAIPIMQMALRHAQDRRAAWLLGGAYLLWFGTHYLDIAIDLKTFRPIAFGAPLMLWWLDALEQAKWKRSLVLLLLVLACKEDYAIVTAPVGLWLAVEAWGNRDRSPEERRFRMAFGLAHAALLTLYLGLVVKVFIPWFRGWENVHYAAYFQALGATPQEIVQTIVLHPIKTLSLFVTFGSILYSLYILVPLVGLPLRSPGRLLCGLPLFLTLCLNELVQTFPGPFHHFHAPLVPILFWAAAAGLGRSWREVVRWTSANSGIPPAARSLLARHHASLALAGCLFTSMTLSMVPWSMKFWDAGRDFYWRTLYIADARARAIEPVLAAIPLTARVASTDFVHTRMTHYERSYDYSDYPRQVANYEDRVPNDTDYIVIDTGHRYSKLRREDLLADPAKLLEIRELRREPLRWEVLDLPTDCYFIVLKRREAASMGEPHGSDSARTKPNVAPLP
ncbi:MAG: DUF2079 domain-containing protein [Planctomycetaceae bacterium]|nr:DUF2079 domain-containing protein [Planctomycetaceae bacterium]